MRADALAGGFIDPPIDASRAFRGIMTAMARPGTISTVTGALPPTPLGVAAGVAVLTLCDPDTPIFLGSSHDTQDVRDWITFQTGAPFVSPAQAVFAIGMWGDLSLPDAQTLHRNHGLYPRGLDFLFTCADRIAALPRTTRIG